MLNTLTRPHDYPGKLFVVEGVDGSGKTTQIGLLAKWLTAAGHRVRLLREYTALAREFKFHVIDARRRVDLIRRSSGAKWKPSSPPSEDDVMRAVVIGGTGFIGRLVVRELLRLGHEVAVVHRGSELPELHGLTQITAHRERLADAAPQLRAFAPDVVVDMILSSGRQAEALLDVFRGHAERVVAISSMDVYRACGVLHGTEPGPLEPLPLTEDSSAERRRLQTYPPAQIAMLQQVFGWLDDEYDKIPVERVVLGDADLPGTVLRLPMVYGPLRSAATLPSGRQTHPGWPARGALLRADGALARDERVRRGRGSRHRACGNTVECSTPRLQHRRAGHADGARMGRADCTRVGVGWDLCRPPG